MRHRGDPVWIRLPGSGRGKIWSDADNQLVQRGRKVLANPSADASGDWSELARQLAGQRLAPLEPALRRAVDGTVVTHLVVLPSPALTGIPLETLTDQYTISYAPSATMFTWLREKGPLSPSPTAPPRLLAVGDPTFAPPDTPTPPLPEPPDHGLLLTMVTPGSNAARGGLQPNDVLLRYAGTPLASRDQLAKALGTPRGEAPVPVVLWRDGKELRQTVAPGPLGVEVSTWPAADMIRARRAADHLVHGLRGAFAPLPETRREVQAIAPLFSEAQTLLGSEASEQNLARLADSGQLAGFQVIHVATHGVLDAARPMRSALILAQDHLPDPAAQVLAGEECYDGRLSTERILRTWRLNADLVTLSACDTALGQPSGGEGQLGFAQALFIAGARSLVLSLWKVDDTATALLMTRFYQNLLGKRAELAAPLSKAEALREAKHWLRTLSRDEADRLKEQLPSTPRGEKHVGDLPRPAADHPYAHPSYWAAFILIGDPGEPSPERANRVVARGIAPSWWVVLGLLAGGVLLGVILVRRWIRLVVAAPRIDPSPPS